MPDLTLCKDDTCPKRHQCLRYMVMPSKTMQSYFMSSPREGDECDKFSEVKKGMKLNPDKFDK